MATKPGVTVRRKLRKEEMDELKDENASLRARLGLDGPRQDWESSGTQELRDGFAAQALIAEWLDEVKALMRLGFDVGPEVGQIHGQELAALKERVFKTPGVTNLCNKNFADVEANKDAILARMTRIAIHDPSSDAAVRAGQVLVKVMGIQKTPDSVNDNRKIITLYNMVNPELQGKEEQKALPETTTANPLTFLDHEPGAPIPVKIDEAS